MQKVYVHSFGCRASQADGSAIQSSLEERGFVAVENRADADLVVINTCTVTHAADLDARRLMRSVHRDQPDTQMLVTGCYAQRAPAELASIEGVRWVVGNSHKTQIADVLSSRLEEYHGQVLVSDLAAQTQFEATPIRSAYDDRTRPNLKVQDGCSNRCSFCIIPAVRGRSRSANVDSVLKQVRDLAERYAEIVLSGINLGRWGRDLPGSLRFLDLLKLILRDTTVQRLRISSVEPMDWSDSLIELVATEPRIAKHVHIPLQAGCDSVLKRMFRKYRAPHYGSRVAAARHLMPDAAIGADVMTGFPGESDAEFDESLRFIEQQPFTYLHVFTYSERPGTLAAERGQPVAVEVRRERTRILRALSDRQNLEFRGSMVGKTLSAVTLDESGIALTSNFLKVQMAQAREPNQIVDLEIGGISVNGLREQTPFPII